VRLAIACAVALLLGGCQALKVAGDVLDALPPPTPQEHRVVTQRPPVVVVRKVATPAPRKVVPKAAEKKPKEKKP
jgi:hypothetical protein